MPADWILPEWPASSRVRAVSTTRFGGVSKAAYASLNFGQHVGDDPAAVAENRRRLVSTLGLKREPAWLKQVHGARVAHLSGAQLQEPADAAVTSKPGLACTVMTADCLPVLFCDRAGTRVAAAHAGWRGLSTGVLEATIAAMGKGTAEFMAWMGPAIGPESYEVGEEVRQAFVHLDADVAVAFTPGKAPGKWWCDLYALARRRLEAAGVTQVYGGGLCTYADRERFFSFRRDGECGRMATLIYLE
ncbi:MAG TPA: peptidoglycan editing factor PgeF [Gammaproteobacteria bacterium]|nr:peptidoglycan editing factor PgeF [Gammaproteobacteria bacterium]